MNAQATGKRIIKGMHSIVNFTVLVIIMLLFAYALYALWDSKQITNAADKSHYEVYKPTAANEGKSFRQLQDINPEVFAWLTVYGTNIDYPVTQGPDNMKYVTTNAEGAYSLSGAIFLDSGNNMDFSDFNSILYGHHMDKQVMFGEIGEFVDREMFDTHRYGNLYFDGKHHGLEFFAFVHADAYDRTVFLPNVNRDEGQAYLDNMYSKAPHIRDIGVTKDDNIILLSTCSSSSTNGRDILVARISDEIYEDDFLGDGSNKGNRSVIEYRDGQYCYVKGIPLWALLVLLMIIMMAVRIVLRILENRNNNKTCINERHKRDGKP